MYSATGFVYYANVFFVIQQRWYLEAIHKCQQLPHTTHSVGLIQLSGFYYKKHYTITIFNVSVNSMGQSAVGAHCY
jgi:hypothetical protein